MPARKEKIKLNDQWKDQIRVGVMMKLLEDHGHGRKKLGPTQIKAIEVYLSKTVPSLSSIEQTVIDARDQLSESDIATQLAGTLSANPDVILKVLDVACEQGMGQRIIDYVAVRMMAVVAPQLPQSTTEHNVVAQH